MKLKTSVAWFLRLKQLLKLLRNKRKEICINENDPEKQRTTVENRINNFKTTIGKQCLCPEDYAKAEQAIIQFVQCQRFKDEIVLLKAGNNVKKDSQLYKLDPVWENGVLRVGGHLNRAAMPEETKHPVILSNDLHVSTLILYHIHQQLRHGGRKCMLCCLRKKYWITNANSAAREVIPKCVTCRRHSGKMTEQKMANLLKERALPDEALFINVGVDYFGPISVKRGRNILKRYGIIFTCFTSRAVHLEMAYTLDTDSCINAIRRFICRRGRVSSIRSDNGTNFVGANREMKEYLAALNHNKIQGALIRDGVTWHFNPPVASHHGGVREHLICSVRSVLSSVLNRLANCPLWNRNHSEQQTYHLSFRWDRRFGDSDTQSHLSLKEKTSLTSWTHRTKRSLHQTEMEAGAVYSRPLLEAVDLWVLNCDARDTKMVQSQKKPQTWRHCHYCRCYSSQKFLDDGQSFGG